MGLVTNMGLGYPAIEEQPTNEQHPNFCASGAKADAFLSWICVGTRSIQAVDPRGFNPKR